MESLSEQYASEVKKVDSVIYERLIEALQVELNEKVQNEDELYKKMEARKAEILSLFNGSFSENEELLRNEVEKQGRKTRSGKYDKHVNQMIKEIVDKTIEKLLEERECSAIATSVGIDRKTFMDALLDKNISINLNRGNEEPEENEGR